VPENVPESKPGQFILAVCGGDRLNSGFTLFHAYDTLDELKAGALQVAVSEPGKAVVLLQTLGVCQVRPELVLL